MKLRVWQICLGLTVEGSSGLRWRLWRACTFTDGLKMANDCQGTSRCTHQLPWIILGIIGNAPLGVRLAVNLMLSCQAAAWLFLCMGDIGLRLLH